MTTRRRQARTWIGIVIGLLTLSISAHAVLLVYALTDPSFAIEPDYERKAASWDDHQRAVAASARLGWTVDLRSSAGDAPGMVRLAVTVTDAEGGPIDEARVEVEAMHVARAASILRATFVTGADGRAQTPLPMRRSGQWEVRYTITRGDDVCVGSRRLSVLSPPVRP
jgi:hypothetical protein